MECTRLPVEEARRLHIDPETIRQLHHVAADDVLDRVAVGARLPRLVRELREVVGARECRRRLPATLQTRLSMWH